MLDILIVDDEPLARDRLARMLQEVGDCNVVALAENGEQAIAEAKRLSPALVFMDVRMPGMDGLAAAQHLAEFEPPPAVIFCTAYDDYAVEAFSSQALGYLLKPVKRAELELAVKRCQRITKAQLAEIDRVIPEVGQGREYVAAKTRRGIDMIPMAGVRLFQADHKYVTAYHIEGEALLDETLKDLEAEFKQGFVRIHRNALISINHVMGLERKQDGRYFVILEGIDIHPQVSRRHVSSLKKRLESL